MQKEGSVQGCGGHARLWGCAMHKGGCNANRGQRAMSGGVCKAQGVCNARGGGAVQNESGVQGTGGGAKPIVSNPVQCTRGVRRNMGATCSAREGACSAEWEQRAVLWGCATHKECAKQNGGSVQGSRDVQSKTGAAACNAAGGVQSETGAACNAQEGVCKAK